MFSETIFMTQMIEEFTDFTKASQPSRGSFYNSAVSSFQQEKELAQLCGRFFEAVQAQFSNKQLSCVYPDQLSSVTHKSSTANYLAEPHPEIMTFNLNWDTDSPGVMDILRTLVSIPEEFNITSLYKASQTAS